jgi:hypothetical protein
MSRDITAVGLTSHNANRATLLEAPTITLTQLPDG